MFERGSITLFHVRGVPIRAHWTLLLVLPYLAAVFSTQFEAVTRLAGVQQVRFLLPPLIWGAILACGLFASVALHEVAHTVVALRFGGRVRSITLMLLGGVSQITHIPRRPRSEGLMAFAGPLTSLLLGGILLAIHRVSSNAPADAKMGLFFLGYLNVILGLFNLIPAFPMDGGRIVRAVLSSRMGALPATRIAAGVGRVTAVLMGFVGLWTGNFLLLMVAGFVYVGAGAEVGSERVRKALERLRIADLVPLIRRPPATISQDAPLAEVLPRMHETGRLDLIVTDAGGAPVAIIQAADLVDVDAEERARIHVRELVSRCGVRHMVVSWDAGANDVLERAAEARATFIVVTDPAMASLHGIIGLLAASDIETMLTLRLVDRAVPARAPDAPRARPLPAAVGSTHLPSQVP